jgi:SET domain-containing protein
MAILQNWKQQKKRRAMSKEESLVVRLYGVQRLLTSKKNTEFAQECGELIREAVARINELEIEEESEDEENDMARPC